MITEGQRDLAKKLKLEKIFLPEVVSLFKSIINTFISTIAITGVEPDLVNLNKRFEKLLKKHYLRVQKEFGITVNTEKKDNQESIEERILKALTLFAEEQSKKNGKLIADTTHADMREAINEARKLLSEQRITVDNRVLASTAVTILKRKINGRLETIVISETQFSAEGSKHEVAKIIQDENSVVPSDRMVILKKWETVGDERVRPTHVIANGQKRILDLPYDVGGFNLQYPGDRSLGAPAREVVNCRCSSVILVKKDMNR